MQIAIFGATGAAGSRITAEAVRRGHTATAVSRRAPQAPLPSGAIWRQGDAADTDQVSRIAAEHDVVVSALGPSREPDGDPDAFAALLQALAGAVGGTRLVVVGGAGSLRTEAGVRLVDTPDFPAAYRPEALAHADALEVLRSAPAELDWTYLSPAPEIAPGERTGRYRVGADGPAGATISFEDYAVALLDEIEHPAHRRARFTVAN